MNEIDRRHFSLKDLAPSTFSSILFISQIVIGAHFLSELPQIEFLAYSGVGLYVFSGIVFGALPVFEFRKKGEVQTGQSYIHTTKIVDTGIYSIVRHPQYVTFILFSISGMLLFQHWIVILVGIPVIPLTYIDLIKADKECVKRFGNDYEAYMKEVPRANFFLGIVRQFKKKKE